MGHHKRLIINQLHFVMEVKNIKSLNEAVYVLRHFVELSAQLLPIYDKITSCKQLNFYLMEEKEKIDEIYSKHKVNPDVGKFLLGSNIIYLITQSYNDMKYRKQYGDKKVKGNLDEFVSEYARLKQEWYRTLMN